MHSKPAYKLRETRYPKQIDRTDCVVVAATSIGESAVPVVGHAVTVERDTDHDAITGEEFAELLVQPYSVGMNRRSRSHSPMRAARSAWMAKRILAGLSQERLASVQNDADLGQAVSLRVLGDTLRGRDDCLVTHDHGPPVPALISTLIHVTMITSQVTPAVNLDYELLQWHGQPAYAGSPG